MNEELIFGDIPFSEAIGGMESPSKVAELRKALTVGYEMGTTDQVGFGATRVESLEKTLKWVVAQEKTARFFVDLKKSKGKSTVEEFSVMNEIGDAGFFVEGGLPEEYNEEIKREFEQTKYIGAVGKVPNVASVVESIVNNIATITRAKAIAILRKCDIKSFFGNSTYNSVEWNGYLEQFLRRVKNPTQNVIDLRGRRLRPETLSEIGTIIMDNYGDPGNIKGWIPPEVYDNYTQELLASRRFMVGTSEARAIIANAKEFELGNATGVLERDIFLRSKGQTYYEREHPKLNSAGSAFASTHAKAPSVLSAGTASATAAGTTGTITAATYDYAVVPVNKFGAGVAYEIENVVVGATEIVTFVLSDNGSPAGQEATAFEIYRKLATATDLSSYQYIKTFATAEVTKTDTGSEMPGTRYGFFFDWNMDQVLDFKQLLPMVKMPLATIDDSIRWLQKLYGTPILYNPNRMVLVKNIGTTAWT